MPCVARWSTRRMQRPSPTGPHCSRRCYLAWRDARRAVHASRDRRAGAPFVPVEEVDAGRPRILERAFFKSSRRLLSSSAGWAFFRCSAHVWRRRIALRNRRDRTVPGAPMGGVSDDHCDGFLRSSSCMDCFTDTPLSAAWLWPRTSPGSRISSIVFDVNAAYDAYFDRRPLFGQRCAHLLRLPCSPSAQLGCADFGKGVERARREFTVIDDPNQAPRAAQISEFRHMRHTSAD